MSDIQKIVDQMDPEKALDELSTITRKLFLVAGTEARNRFVANMVGRPGNDRVGSMAHL